MKRYILFILLAVSFSSFAQVLNDYRSNPSGGHGNFDNLQSWQKYTYFWFILTFGPTWYSSSVFTFNFNSPPSILNTDSTNIITIRNNDEITVNNTVSVYNITVDTGAVLKVNQGDTLFILKNLIVNGTLINDGVISVSEDLTMQNAEYADAGTIIYMGTSSKFLKVGVYNNLVINNNGITSLSKNIRIKGNLTLLNGNIFLGQYNLTLSGNSSIYGTTGSSKMIIASGSGKVRKEILDTGSFTFPVGDNTNIFDYSPVTLNFTNGTFENSFVEINLVDAKHPENNSNTYISRYWKISQTGISNFLCRVTFSYVNSDVTGNEANIYTGKYDGEKWELFNQANAVQNQLSATVNSFSDFTGGELHAFPVELISFDAYTKNGKIILSWKTATEVNNYGFEIERSYNNDAWRKIDFVNGFGNSNSEKSYSYTDNDVSDGGNYSYRLKQIDIDGSFEYSNEINITLNAVENYSLNQNYPNPFNPTTKIKYTIPAVETRHTSSLRIVTLKVYDTLGREVAILVNHEQSPGNYEVEFSGNGLPSGIYFYKLSATGEAGNFHQTKKMILAK